MIIFRLVPKRPRGRPRKNPAPGDPTSQTRPADVSKVDETGLASAARGQGNPDNSEAAQVVLACTARAGAGPYSDRATPLVAAYLLLEALKSPRSLVHYGAGPSSQNPVRATANAILEAICSTQH